VAYDASQMYAKNVSTFLLHLVKDGRVRFDLEDQITLQTLVARRGEVVHPKVREALGITEEPAAEIPVAVAAEAVAEPEGKVA